MVRGFTLIELIISTAVIAMMLAVSLPAFIGFQRRQNLLTGAQGLRDAILETQNFALAPRGSDGSSQGKLAGADRYRIVLTNVNNRPGYEIDEQINTDVTSPLWQSVKSGGLAQGVGWCVVEPNLLTSLDPPTQDRFVGLIYSISQLGQIVKPATTGTVSVRLKHQALASQALVSVQLDTGRVDIETRPQAVSCG